MPPPATPDPASTRVAVLGLGLAGKVFHCPFVSAVPGLRLEAIVARSEASAAAAAAAYPAAQVLRTPEDAFADPAIDLIVVGTPNPTHVALATAALQAGKHVLVDKPLAPTSAEVQTLTELAGRQGRLLIPFHNRRWDGDFLTLHQLLADGTLGRVTAIHSRFDRFRPLPREGSWKELAAPASGILYDLGVHLLDQALALCGTPSHMSASVRTERDGSAIDDAFDVTLTFPTASGHSLLYTVGSTSIAAAPSPRFLAHGTLGSYTKYGLDPQEPTVIAGTFPPPLGPLSPAWLPEPEAAWGTLTLCPDPATPKKLTSAPLRTVPGDYRRFYQNVRDAIRGTAPLAVTPADGFRSIRLVELALRSSREGCILPVTF